MQEERLELTTDSSQNSKHTIARKKRVKRMKIAIIISAIILLILPTLICIILGFQVVKLQKQVDSLIIDQKSTTNISRDDPDIQQEVYPSTSGAETADKSKHKMADQDNQSDSDSSVSNTETSAQTQSDSSKEGTALSVAESQSNIVAGHTSKDSKPTLIPSLSPGITPSTIPKIMTGLTPTGIPSLGTVIADKPFHEQQANQTTVLSQAAVVSTNDANNSANAKPLNKPKKGKTGKITSLSIDKIDQKKVYLTFDDGPSEYTDEILDILAQYHVKATFFVIGKTDEHSKRMYKRIVTEGHTLGMHSYSHIYAKIYNSLEDFDRDFTKLWKLLYDTTGYKPILYRFPGGSANQVNKNGMDKFIKYLNDKSMIYFDWNVVNGDATGVTYTKEQLIDNVLNGVKQKDRSIVLMHDSLSKKTTVESLPGLLEALLSEGVQILPLDENVPPIQQIKADSFD